MRPRKLHPMEVEAAGYRLTRRHFNPFGRYVYVPNPRYAFLTYHNYLALLEVEKYKEVVTRGLREFAKVTLPKVNSDNFSSYAKHCPWKNECETCKFEVCPVLQELKEIIAFEKAVNLALDKIANLKTEGEFPNEPISKEFEKAEFEVLKDGMHT